MTLKRQIKKEGLRGRGSKKWMLSRTLYVLFFILGSILSLSAFLSVESMTASISDASYDRISEEMSEAIRKEVVELEFSMRTISTLVALSGDRDDQRVIEKLQTVGQSLEDFQAVFWLHKPQGENSKLYPLFSAIGFQNKERFNEALQQDVLRRALSNALSRGDQTFLVTNLDAPNDNIPAHLFAMVRAVPVQGGDTGAIVAFTDLGYVFQQSFLRIDQLVSSLAIRDVDTGHQMFAFDKVDTRAPIYEKMQSYDLKVANHTWEINSQYFIQDNLMVLTIFPYMIFAFLMIVTVAGTLYLRNNHTQALRFSDMNEQLAEKNAALQMENKKRERLNKLANRAEKENRAIIDSVSDIIFEADADGLILFLNARWSKITGFDVEQSSGQNFFKMLHPQDQEQIEEEFRDLLDGKKHEFRTFTRLRTAQGSFRAVELAVSMVREDARHEKRIVGTLTDVEERRRAERALSQAEKKYRNIVENAAGGIFQLTPEGVYLSANPAMARILGYDSPEQILREVKNANESIYVDTLGRAAFIEELKLVGSISNHETEVKCRDGYTIWVNENIRNVNDEAGNILYFEGSLEDISERKRASIALQDAKMHSDLANRAKSEFLANMSHELRTPLNSIIGFSEMIKNEVFGPLEQKAYWEYARDIHGSGQKLLDVINEILDISKIEAGERQLNEGLVDLEDCVLGCLELLQRKIEGGDIVITNNLSQVPDLIGEELALKQIIMNLLSNAVKFTPSNGRVTISSELDREGRLQLSITDTGVGLDEEGLKKALSPFGQVNSEHNREGSGTGLGLTLVDALLKLHGAEFELVSQKGIGTTATAIFPAERVQQKSEQRVVVTSKEDA